jgi:hypothetical protein
MLRDAFMRAAMLAFACYACTSSSGVAICPKDQPAGSSPCASDHELSCSYGTTTECTCEGGTGSRWSCTYNDCSWYAGADQCTDGSGGAFYCTCAVNGATCMFSNWEHECDCTCETSAMGSWWSCESGTIGSVCPSGPPPP